MSLRRKNMDAHINEYEQQRQANIARNLEQLQSFQIPTMNTVVQPCPAKKRTKKTHHTSHAPIDGHNLRPRPQKNNVDTANEQIVDDPEYEPTGDFLCDNEDLLGGTQKKRNGRGITKMNGIFSRTTDMPKIKITLNEFGQPVGENARKLSSVIGCQLRKKLSVGCDDWRLVDAEKKLAVWTNIKAIYDLDDAAINWFMATAGRKWKEYKADLKVKFFDETLTDEELKERASNRVNAADWDFLIGFWRSPESKARTARAKANRAKLQLHHTSGSVSHACRRHDLGQELGRPPRRDEVYINTHTRKNGVPLRQAAPTINELKSIVEVRPELKDRSIQQGDVYAAVCGVKEPKGRVRVLGLGPTPQEIGTPGLKSYMPTRLQLEVLARKKAESVKATLEQRIVELQEQVHEERMTREMLNVETLSQHGSNSRQHMSPRSEGHVDARHDAQCEEIHNSADNEDCDQDIINDENLLVHRHVDEAPPMPSMNVTSTRRNEDAPRFAHDTLVGKDVILFAMLRSDLPVAKGTVLSTNPKTMVGGQPLGKQFVKLW